MMFSVSFFMSSAIAITILTLLSKHF